MRGFDKRSSESHLPPLSTQCGNFVIKDEDKAELLNSVYIEQNTSLLADDESFPYGPTDVRMKFCLKHVSPVEVGKTLQSLPRKHSAGHDGISYSLLKEAGPGLILPLTTLFNRSIELGKYHRSGKLL